MAKIFPDYSIIKNLKQNQTSGELMMLDSIIEHLDNSFEVYWQPYLNGDQPDLVIVRPDSGILIIEVKDWDLNNYYVDKRERWYLKNNNQLVKSPLSQVEKYKWNMVNLHIGTLLEKTIKHPGYFSIINRLLFFSKNKEQKVLEFFQENYSVKKLRYLELFGYDSLTSQRFQRVLEKARLDKDSRYFNEQLYLNLKRYLKPPYHQIDEGIPINYTNSQKLLIESVAKERKKIVGVAGSGKTLVLAKRAVNAHIRTDDKVLILTYNIALKNYVHDRISDVRQNFEWGAFEIINYHQFFLAKANNHGLIIHGLEDWQNEKFFESCANYIRKYSTIVIDEVQDYRTEWLRIITKYFLKEDGEFIVFGDEKQNIYDRPLDEVKKPVVPTIPGAWNKTLKESHRFQENLARLAVRFQNEFLKHKYDVDKIEILQYDQTALFGNKVIEYYYFAEPTDSNIYQMVMRVAREKEIHPSDICILDSRVKAVRKLDFLIRTESLEKTTTTFETQEVYDHLLNQLKYKYYPPNFSSLSDNEQARIDKKVMSRLEDKIEDIRRNKKFHFYMKTGTMKLSTIHSFKGWEAPALILIIDDESDEKSPFTTEELIYTGFTRAQFSLFIFNLEKNKYDSFFCKEIDASYNV